MKRSDHKKRIQPSHQKQSVQRFAHAPQLVVDGVLVGGSRGATQPGELRAQAPGETQPPLPESTAASTPQQAASPETSPSTASAKANPAPTPVTDPPVNRATVLEALIEEERVELMQVFGVLKCLYDVLLYSDDDDAANHADVALVCARLINEFAIRLEILVKRYKSGEFRAAPTDSTSTAEADGSPAIRDRTDDAGGKP